MLPDRRYWWSFDWEEGCVVEAVMQCCSRCGRWFVKTEHDSIIRRICRRCGSGIPSHLSDYQVVGWLKWKIANRAAREAVRIEKEAIKRRAEIAQLREAPAQGKGRRDSAFKCRKPLLSESKGLKLSLLQMRLEFGFALLDADQGDGFVDPDGYDQDVLPGVSEQ